MRFALTSFILGSLLLVGACSDSSYNSNSNTADRDLIFVQDPTIPEPLSVIISASITDQLTGNIIENASVSFFEASNEGSVAATNVRSIDGQSVNSPISTEGGFQVTAENGITTFSVVVSADGYIDKIATINFDPTDEVVTTRINMLAVAVEAVSVVSQDVAVGGSAVAQKITVSTDVANVDETTEGSAQVEVPADVELRDGQGVWDGVTTA